MRLQNVLEEEVNKYVKSTPNLHIIEKLLGNEGGVLYSVEYNKVKKSLFATSLEKEQLSLKKVFDNICQDSMSGDDSLFRIESMTCKEVMEENQIIGCYVFMLMEQIEPLVQEILEEDSTSWQITDNQKKIKLLSYIIKTCENVEELKRKYPDINIFINNEEICVNQNGEAKILLLDLVKNEIATENQAYEIAIIMNYFSSGLGLESNIQAEVRKLEELKRLYIEEKNQLYILEEKYRKKLNQNLEFAENGDVRAYCNLGYMYEHGMGVDRDFMQAINWYKKAAARKYAPAYNNLAHLERVTFMSGTITGAPGGFAGCTNLKTIKVYGSTLNFHWTDMILETVHGYAGGTLEMMADSEGIEFIPIDEKMSESNDECSWTSSIGVWDYYDDYVDNGIEYINYASKNNNDEVTAEVLSYKDEAVGELAIDGNPYTKWRSEYADLAYITIDLGAIYSVKKSEYGGVIRHQQIISLRCRQRGLITKI